MRLRSRMAFRAGYLMGSRAGPERYDQITGTARDFVALPVVKTVLNRAIDFVDRSSSSSSSESRTRQPSSSSRSRSGRTKTSR